MVKRPIVKNVKISEKTATQILWLAISETTVNIFTPIIFMTIIGVAIDLFLHRTILASFSLIVCIFVGAIISIFLVRQQIARYDSEIHLDAGGNL